jgi:hypothetical protein
MTFVVPVLGSAMEREANSNKFNFFSAMRPCKRRNDTSYCRPKFKEAVNDRFQISLAKIA